MESPESPAPQLPGAKTYVALIGTLSMVGAVPLCWWLADQGIIPWGDEARWMMLQRTTDGAASVSWRAKSSLTWPPPGS
jgi:hypothetical protein